MKRDPLDKEKFLEGNRQKWAVIFLLCGFGVLLANIAFAAIDPSPYMQFLLAIGSLFILGASGDSWVKAYSVKSIRETEITQGGPAVCEDFDPEVATAAQLEYSDDPSYAPEGWVDEDDGGDTFR